MLGNRAQSDRVPLFTACNGSAIDGIRHCGDAVACRDRFSGNLQSGSVIHGIQRIRDIRIGIEQDIFIIQAVALQGLQERFFLRRQLIGEIGALHVVQIAKGLGLRINGNRGGNRRGDACGGRTAEELYRTAAADGIGVFAGQQAAVVQHQRSAVLHTGHAADAAVPEGQRRPVGHCEHGDGSAGRIDRISVGDQRNILVNISREAEPAVVLLQRERSARFHLRNVLVQLGGGRAIERDVAHGHDEGFVKGHGFRPFRILIPCIGIDGIHLAGHWVGNDLTGPVLDSLDHIAAQLEGGGELELRERGAFLAAHGVEIPDIVLLRDLAAHDRADIVRVGNGVQVRVIVRRVKVGDHGVDRRGVQRPVQLAEGGGGCLAPGQEIAEQLRVLRFVELALQLFPRLLNTLGDQPVQERLVLEGIVVLHRLADPVLSGIVLGPVAGLHIRQRDRLSRR